MSIKRIAVFGGAFDPFHLGHLAMARAAKAQLAFDEILLIPTYTPAHKPCAMWSYEDRIAMLKAVQASKPSLSMQVSDIESTLPSPSYTYRTFQALHAKAQTPVEFTLLLGEDSYYSLPSWDEWQTLASLCTIAVFPRQANAKKESLPEARATWLHSSLWPISSTFVRKKLAQGHSVQPFVPPAVYQWLRSRTKPMTEKDQNPAEKQKLVQQIQAQLDDQKAKEIETIDLEGAAQFADTMIVASGTSTRHVASLARGLQEKVKETLGQKPLGIEGLETAEWVLVDFGDVIVHIMLPATRQFYELEKLWKVRPQERSSNDATN